MKHALVTGATGFVGRWVVWELIQHGVRVTVPVRADSQNLSALEGLPVQTVICDMDSYHLLPQLLPEAGIDTVYHFAWRGVSNPEARDDAVQLHCIQATLDLVDAAHQLGADTFIGAGSLHEAEGAWELAVDKPITNPGFLYKAAKNCAHGMAKTKAGQLGMRFLWPVISNAYGEGGGPGRLINSVIRQVLEGNSPALSEGTQWYDFVHVSDVAQAFRLLGEKGVDGTNYLIGSGKPQRLKQWLSKVGKAANRERKGEDIPLGFGQYEGFVAELPKSAFSINNLQRDTDYTPTVTFQEGIRRLVEQWEA